jgi:N-methylhydantoinase A
MIRIGADVGGTFTDLVLLNSDGRVRARKVPSSPADFGQAVVDGIADLLDQAAAVPSTVPPTAARATLARPTVRVIRAP